MGHLLHCRATGPGAAVKLKKRYAPTRSKSSGDAGESRRRRPVGARICGMRQSRYGCLETPLAARKRGAAEEEAMGALLRENILGINILTLAGFVVMGFGLTLRRMGRAGTPLCLGLMSVGTGLVFLGLYADRLPDF